MVYKYIKLKHINNTRTFSTEKLMNKLQKKQKKSPTDPSIYSNVLFKLDLFKIE